MIMSLRLSHAAPHPSNLPYMHDSSDLFLPQIVPPYHYSLQAGNCSVQEQRNLHNASRNNPCRTSTRSPRKPRSGVLRVHWAVLLSVGSQTDCEFYAYFCPTETFTSRSCFEKQNETCERKPQGRQALHGPAKCRSFTKEQYPVWGLPWVSLSEWNHSIRYDRAKNSQFSVEISDVYMWTPIG